MEETEVAGVVAAAVAAAVAATHDRRSNRQAPLSVLTACASPWDLVQGDQLHNGWYERHLRCWFSTFEEIVARVEAQWTTLHKQPGPKSVHIIKTRVAVTLCYLTHEGSFHYAGSLFGVSKARCIAHVNEVTSVLNTCYLAEAVRLPASAEEWGAVASGFEAICDVPSAVGAIDGSLFPVHRFADYEGWYCRKGFPAFNMQVSSSVPTVQVDTFVVDANKRIMSFSLRSGSQNDKAGFNNSSFGKACQDLIPAGAFFLADAGYKLMPHVMTPFKIYYGMPRDEARYNYLHSKMRIVVEAALGLFKGRFRLFKVALGHHSPEKMARLILASIVLHNWLLGTGDTTVSNEPEEWMHIGGDTVSDENVEADAAANIRRVLLTEYMMTL